MINLLLAIVGAVSLMVGTTVLTFRWIKGHEARTAREYWVHLILAVLLVVGGIVLIVVPSRL